jgi:uncharacterized membrane protein YagU involved in acid resistance
VKIASKKVSIIMNDPYYTLDPSLFDGQFRYFGSEIVNHLTWLKKNDLVY